MKRAALLFIGLALGTAQPATAAVRALDRDQTPLFAAQRIGGRLGVEVAQRDRTDRQDDRRNEPDAPAKARISPQQAEAAVARVSPGRALNIELIAREGRPYYQIRWQTKDGRRVDYLVDGTSGVIAGGG
jgi:uncharacterized membrane protein YkoI